jgi:hypothetical protein
MFSQLGGTLSAGYRGIGLAPELSLESGKDTPSEVPTHH